MAICCVVLVQGSGNACEAYSALSVDDGKADGMDGPGLFALTVSNRATRNEDVQVFVRVDN